MPVFCRDLFHFSSLLSSSHFTSNRRRRQATCWGSRRRRMTLSHSHTHTLSFCRHTGLGGRESKVANWKKEREDKILCNTVLFFILFLSLLLQKLVSEFSSLFLNETLAVNAQCCRVPRCEIFFFFGAGEEEDDGGEWKMMVVVVMVVLCRLVDWLFGWLAGWLVVCLHEWMDGRMAVWLWLHCNYCSLPTLTLLVCTAARQQQQRQPCGKRHQQQQHQRPTI